MQRMIAIIGLALSVASASYAKGTKPEDAVRVIDAEAAKACKMLGVVSGRAILNSPNKMFEKSIKGAKKRAVVLGANAIAIISTESRASEAFVAANAYRCES